MGDNTHTRALPPDAPLAEMTKAMVELGEGMFLASNSDKDQLSARYLTFRCATASRFPHAPAHATDPWGWEDFKVTYQARNGRAYTGRGDAITAAMVTSYLGLAQEEETTA